MIQIITGKFFTSDDTYTIKQRAVLYTNYVMPEMQFDTPSGTLFPTHDWHDIQSVIYDVDMCLEYWKHSEKRAKLLVPAEFLVNDFAVISSFILNVIFARDASLINDLTRSRRLPNTSQSEPQKYIRRVFDGKVDYVPGDELKLHKFIEDLVGLRRPTFEAAMRAIRRYVGGLHRIAEDVDLAYTLLVASIESLAQKFDAFTPTWDDFDQNKRGPIEKALSGVPTDAAERVRVAILAQEHVSLARRFRQFALNNISPAFFREEAVAEVNPIRRSDLPSALDSAYRFRSGYVHTLRQLPKQLHPHGNSPQHNDAVVIEGKHMLTIHGLARIARHVIMQFIIAAEKTEKEEFNYLSNLPIMLKFSGVDIYTHSDFHLFWMRDKSGYNHKTARRYLSGFLRELTAVRLKQEGAKITDIRLILEEIEQQVKGLAHPEQRIPMLTLYLFWHQTFDADTHRPNWKNFLGKYANDLSRFTPETMVIMAFAPRSGINWLEQLGEDEAKLWASSLTELLAQAWEEYVFQKLKKDGLLLPPLVEAAVRLVWAEACRRAGDIERSRQLISAVVEDLPGNERLIEFEATINTHVNPPPINWHKLLLPLAAATTNNPDIATQKDSI